MTLFRDFVLVVFCSVYGCAFALSTFYFFQLIQAAIRCLIFPPATTDSNGRSRRAIRAIRSP